MQYTFHPDDLYNMAKSGVYALINDVDRKAYIGVSISIMRSLEAIITQIRGGVKSELGGLVADSSKLSRIVLLEETSKENNLVRLAHWCSKFKDEGWVLYNTYQGVKHTIRKTIENSQWEGPGRYRIYVKLRNRLKKDLVVGVFAKMEEADAFIERYYSNLDDYYIVYASNEYTRRWMSLEEDLNEPDPLL